MSAAELIRQEIATSGAIPFERFMQQALYAPGAGYYTRTRDPFGKEGDFYTAEQMQPVFGILMRQLIAPLLEQTGGRTVVELGAGRGEMAEAFREFEYVPVVPGREMPEHFSGVIFANEFFDALPVHLARRKRGKWRELCVTVEDSRFVFASKTKPLAPAGVSYLTRHHQSATDGAMVEVNLNAREWIKKITYAAGSAWLLIIDYGYTGKEWIRHAQGTLMSYHRHQASDDVLADAGDRDITAHVAWTPLAAWLSESGWKVEPLRTLGHALLDAGAGDRFASLFSGCDAREEMRRRLQLKTLLFGMGETFRVLLASKGIHQ